MNVNNICSEIYIDTGKTNDDFIYIFAHSYSGARKGEYCNILLGRWGTR
jgi:hypothetical protein